MSTQVLEIGDSPIPDSDTNRTLRKILELAGLETEFIKLRAP